MSEGTIISTGFRSLANGDYISSVSQGLNVSFVTWTDGRDGDPDIYFARIVSHE